MQKADLHLHSNKSDGLLSPTGVVEEAAKLKLAAIALTDHDTTDGIHEAISAGRRLDVEVIPGIEINTSADNGELHILGYYIDPLNKHLIEFLEKLTEARQERIRKIICKLQNLGFDITYRQVRSNAGNASSMGRPHIARVLQENGYVSSIREAFEKHIGRGSPAYVERQKLLPKEAVKLIKNSGGVPVLAHPGILSSPLYIETCIDYGIQGLEAYHSSHQNFQSNRFESIANRYGLIVTGGSDSHGECGYDGARLIGSVTVPYRAVELLKYASDNNRNRAEK
jgi:hypothetical protein